MKSKTADTDGTIIEFMQGSHSYDGIWFGEPHPILKGQFWWRTILREYLSSGKFHHPVPDEAPKEWEEQAIKDYENGYESETSAIDKFVFADEAGEVYVWVKASEILPKERVCVRYTVDGKMKYFDSDDWYTLDGLDVEWLCKYTPAPPSGEDAVRFAEWILSEAILPRDTNWFDAGKHYTSQELYQQYLTAPKP